VSTLAFFRAAIKGAAYTLEFFSFIESDVPELSIFRDSNKDCLHQRGQHEIERNDSEYLTFFGKEKPFDRRDTFSIEKCQNHLFSQQSFIFEICRQQGRILFN